MTEINANHTKAALESYFFNDNIKIDVSVFGENISVRVKTNQYIQSEYTCSITSFDYKELLNWIKSLINDKEPLPFDTIEWEDDIWVKDTQ